MKRILVVALCVVLCVALFGCSVSPDKIIGAWDSVNVSADIEFKADGSYQTGDSLRMSEAWGVPDSNETGKYSISGDTLTLSPNDAGRESILKIDGDVIYSTEDPIVIVYSK